MAMDKESPPLPNLHGRSHIRRPTHVFPSGRNTLALMLTAGLFVLLLSTHHPATFYHYPMPTDISPQEAKIGKAPLTSIYLSALSCFFFMQKCPFLFLFFSFSEAYRIFLRFQYDIAAHEIPAQYVYNACDFKSIWNLPISAYSNGFFCPDDLL